MLRCTPDEWARLVLMLDHGAADPRGRRWRGYGDGARGLRGGAAGCTSAQVVSQFTSHLLEQPRELRPDAQVVVMTAHGTMETAIQAMQQGAYDYLAKPFDLDEACSSPSAR